MKLTIPSIKNIKRREAFLLSHPNYYSPQRFEHELLLIAKIRSEKKLRWHQPLMQIKNIETVARESRDNRLKETAKTFEIVPKKQSLFKKAINVFKSQRGA